jgi:hypothetical protein
MKGHGEEIAIKAGEEVDILKHAASPPEVFQLLSWSSLKRQKALFPDVLYGGVQGYQSGFAISQLLASVRYKLAPYIMSFQQVLADVMTDFLVLYKDGNYPPIKLTAKDPQALKKGMFFVEEFSTKDVPESLYIDVTIPVQAPTDKTQQIQFARQAVADPPVLSLETIWDEILDVQDSEQEYTRLDQDRMMRDPIVMQIAIIEQLRERELFYRQKGNIPAADALHRYIMQLELQIGMRQGIPQAPGAPGVNPSTMPPEMVNNPDMMAAAMGQGPQGLSRPPQTPEQRMAGQSGQLYGPGGETLA